MHGTISSANIFSFSDDFSIKMEQTGYTGNVSGSNRTPSIRGQYQLLIGFFDSSTNYISAYSSANVADTLQIKPKFGAYSVIGKKLTSIVRTRTLGGNLGTGVWFRTSPTDGFLLYTHNADLNQVRGYSFINSSLVGEGVFLTAGSVGQTGYRLKYEYNANTKILSVYRSQSQSNTATDFSLYGTVDIGVTRPLIKHEGIVPENSNYIYQYESLNQGCNIYSASYEITNI